MSFCVVNNDGDPNYDNARNANGVRPDFDAVIQQVISVLQQRKERLSFLMVNTNHDMGSYDCSHYPRDISDGNALYNAYIKSKKGCDWKPQIQKFEMTYLLSLSKIQQDLQDGGYQFSDGESFVLHERGKTRYVTGDIMQDRIVKHVLCDEVLIPSIRKYLIHDNGASLEGKGISFTRRRLELHLHRFYNQHHSNEGYILLMDFSKYYDNIRHDILLQLFSRYVTDKKTLDLLARAVDKSKVDVSYLSEEDYACCMQSLFCSLEHAQIDPALLTGEKFMSKHLNIGDQISQGAGIAYRIPIDNYMKIVKGIRFYGAYMDDSYAIHENKEFLEQTLSEVIAIAKENGITINRKKTRICKLSEMWRFLQIQYSLTDSGRVVHKINPKRVTAMRRKLKKLSGRLSKTDFVNLYQSWINGNTRYMSRQQKQNMQELFHQLLKKYESQAT